MHVVDISSGCAVRARLLCFEPDAALLGLSLLHLTILPDSNQDGTRPEPEQLVQLIFMSELQKIFL